MSWKELRDEMVKYPEGCSEIKAEIAMSDCPLSRREKNKILEFIGDKYSWLFGHHDHWCDLYHEFTTYRASTFRNVLLVFLGRKQYVKRFERHISRIT